MCNNQHMRIMSEINYKAMKLINIIKKKISKILNNPYMQIIIEYLSICILPSFICTVLCSILVMTFIHFRITLIAYPTFTVVESALLFPPHSGRIDQQKTPLPLTVPPVLYSFL